ncbi:MAG: TonB family protein [Acidobacteriota bacterium]|nr:TonB family protein [Acidobacteriota bacterium]
MQPAVQRARERRPGLVIDVTSRPRSADVNLGVEWGSRREEFRTSVRDFLFGPRPAKDFDAAGAESLRVEFVEQRWPLGGFVASCAWHVAAIWLLILPIWGFLPKVTPTLEAPQIEVTWYTTPEDLPKILLPSAATKRLQPKRKTAVAVKAASERAEETYHPRQTIFSEPVRVTHPRQTLIEPRAPLAPPKIAPELPNLVQWAASEVPKIHLELTASKVAPKIARREAENAVAPQMTDARPSGVRLDLLSADAPKKLAMPLSGTPAVAARRRSATASAAKGQAPEIGEASASDANVRQIIALSATPALAAPKASVPVGNLAARIGMSPEGRKSGAGARADAADSAMRGDGTLPAAISVSGRDSRAANGQERPGNFRSELGLRPYSRTDAESLRPSAPARIDVANISPSLPPETVFSGRQVYTMNINMPNVTSASGSWILNFAELDSADDTPMHRRAALRGPEPLMKVDPKYPPELIREHVQGEVVLYGIIRKNGTVDSIRVMRSLDPKLDRDAAAALGQWKFRPGTRGGVPVDIEAVVHIPFNYANSTQ